MTDDLEPTEPELIGLVRERLYVPDGKPPAGWHVGRDVKILRALEAEGLTKRDLLDAIEGLALLRDSGAISWAPRRQKVTLRALYHSGSGVRSVVAQALEAVYKAAPRRRQRPVGASKAAAAVPGTPQPLGDVLGAVLRKVASQ